MERLASILQGKDNNYDTDAFTPIMARIQQLAEHTDAERQTHLYRYRAIADHARSCTFMIGDGVMPGNEGRQYVLRMILRRAARFGKIIGFDAPFLAQIADVVIEEMGQHYTDLPAKRAYILQTITDEEERFHRTLHNGLRIIDDLMARVLVEGRTEIDGQEAFFLWDTFGFPIDLTRDVAQDNGLTVDEAGFRVALAEQKEKSRATAVEKVGPDLAIYAEVLQQLKEAGVVDTDGVRYRIYDSLGEIETSVAALIVGGQAVASANAGDRSRSCCPKLSSMWKRAARSAIPAKSTIGPKTWMSRCGRWQSPKCASRCRA